MKAKVRGIYSTALTKLLLDNDFEIIQPSLTIKKRFGLPENPAPLDLKIKDRYDLQGVRVLGTSEAVNTFQSVIHFTFEDALTRKWRVSVDGIYKGNMVESDEDTVYVDIGNDIMGRLPKSESVNVNEKQVTVQVERKRIGAKNPVLSTKLKIVGNYAILVQNNKVGVSLKIRDLNKRAELYTLGKELAPDGWGIIWRESSANQPRETLENEITTLVEKAKILNEKAPNVGAPALLIEGLYFMDVEFPSVSKTHLDKLRASLAQTLDRHHFYKSCGGKVSAALEMAEKLLEKGRGRSEVEELFKKQIMFEFPEVGSLVDIEHVKLSGLVFHLGQGKIESINDEQIRYSRIMRSSGFYDGLGVRKEAGDKAVSETKRGEWFIKTKYSSKDGVWKGTYINLNTPVEVYPKTLRYIDLEVDVCIKPDGTIEVLDMEKLEKALEKSFISKTLFEIVNGITNKLDVKKKSFSDFMPKQSTCIKVPKTYGEKAIVLANKLKIVNKELEIQRDNHAIYIPLMRQPETNELKTLKEQVPDCKVSTYSFPKRKKQVTTFVELLEDKLSPHLLASLPRAIDFVGDIAIIEIPPELNAYKNVIGEAILRVHKNLRTVLAKAGAVSGTYRLREFGVIAGEPKTKTVHKEYGCQYYVDIAKAYFSPRLSYEHNRVASLVQEGETVVDLFAGVGPFAVPIAKTHENVKIYAIDVNAHAVEFLKKNVRLNRVEGKVHPILGDAKKTVRERLLGVADHVIMNLPEKAIEFVDAACEAIKPTGGIVHFYSFANTSNTLEDVKVRFVNAVEKSGRNVEKILFSRFVRATAPYEWQAVLDTKIR